MCPRLVPPPDVPPKTARFPRTAADHVAFHRRAEATHIRAAELHEESASLHELHAAEMREAGSELSALRAERLAD